MAVPSSGQLRLNGDINLEINGTGTGTNVSLNTLSSQAGFTAPNGMEEFYGYSSAVAPSVQTNSSISVGTSSMTIRGNVSSDGGGAITERGFYFGTSTNATSNTKYTVSGTTGAFSRSMTGLSSGTTYRVFAYATNSAGTTIASMVTTSTTQPSIGSYITMSFSGLPTSVGTYATVSSNYNQYFVNNSGTNVTLSKGGRANTTLKIVNWASPYGATRNLPQTFPNGYNNDYGRITMSSSGSSGSIYLVASASGYISTSYLIGT